MSINNPFIIITIVFVIFFFKCLKCDENLIKNDFDRGAKVFNITQPNPNDKILVTKEISETTERIQFKKNETVLRTRYVPKVDDKRYRTRKNYEVIMPKYSIDRMGNDNYNQNCKSGKKVKTEIVSNKTYTMRNGKKYRVIKVTNSRKCKSRDLSVPPLQQGHTIQRRTFNTGGFNSLVPNFSSIFSVPWKTKKEPRNGTEYESENENENKPWDFWSRLKSFHPSGNDLQKPANNYHGEKLKKFLNLFTIVKFDNGGCYANGLRGTCYHQAECEAKGGRPIGTCAKGFGICCYIEKTCGMRTRENCTYFVNEGFPKPSTAAPKICALTVDKADPAVQQLRIEFQTFEIRGPTNGTCLTDRFIITGHNTNDILPDICGVNTGQHVYVDVDESKGPYLLNVVTMGDNSPRIFRIKVTQLKRNDEYLAPKNCLQYYTEPNGVIQTFNYQYGENGNLPSATPGYFNNLNYAVCVKKEKGFCSITYENVERPNVDPSFQLTNVDEDGERLVPPRQGGAEIFNCPDDYIIVNGLRLCGERLNDASVDVDYTKNYPVIDHSNGPFILPVKTNGAVTGRGFYLNYKQNPCMG